jgi:hypothetical protein
MKGENRKGHLAAAAYEAHVVPHIPHEQLNRLLLPLPLADCSLLLLLLLLSRVIPISKWPSEEEEEEEKEEGNSIER